MYHYIIYVEMLYCTLFALICAAFRFVSANIIFREIN